MKAADPPAQRAGFCVIDRKTDLFLTDDTASPHGFVAGRGFHYGYCKASGPVRIWLSLPAAVHAASQVNGAVTTAPRDTGHYFTWDEVST